MAAIHGCLMYNVLQLCVYVCVDADWYGVVEPKWNRAVIHVIGYTYAFSAVTCQMCAVIKVCASCASGCKVSPKHNT